jgi:hypothetical protein
VGALIFHYCFLATRLFPIVTETMREVKEKVGLR